MVKTVISKIKRSTSYMVDSKYPLRYVYISGVGIVIAPFLVILAALGGVMDTGIVDEVGGKKKFTTWSWTKIVMHNIIVVILIFGPALVLLILLAMKLSSTFR